ncbi:MAG: energy-coupling factor ABC transporter permease [Bacilli bacterium]
MKIKLSKNEKKLVIFATLFALLFGIVPNVYAMHIMEGYLPPAFCIAWGLICIPFVIVGYISIKNILKENPRSITLFAMAGAFVFVLSALKIPSVTGSSSHMTGVGFGTILFGPFAVSILGIIALIFQTVLLAHGGLTTLGANTFSMAIAGPFATYFLYKVCFKLKVSKHKSIFIAAFGGNLFTYCITSFQLGIAYPSVEGGILASIIKFLIVFAPTQIPLAIIEGILTVLLIMALETYAKPVLKNLKFFNGGKINE